MGLDGRECDLTKWDEVGSDDRMRCDEIVRQSY